MKLSCIDSLLLKLLHGAPEMTGEITQLLAQKGVILTIAQAKTIGRKLHAVSYIELTESRNRAEAVLMNKGLDYLISQQG